MCFTDSNVQISEIVPFERSAGDWLQTNIISKFFGQKQVAENS